MILHKVLCSVKADLKYFVVAFRKTPHCVWLEWMRDFPLLTWATFENIICLQLKGHDHAVKSTQLSSGYQHSADSGVCWSVRFPHMCIKNIKSAAPFMYCTYLTLFLWEAAVSLACPRLPKGGALNPQSHCRTETEAEVRLVHKLEG